MTTQRRDAVEDLGIVDAAQRAVWSRVKHTAGPLAPEPVPPAKRALTAITLPFLTLALSAAGAERIPLWVPPLVATAVLVGAWLRSLVVRQKYDADQAQRGVTVIGRRSARAGTRDRRAERLALTCGGCFGIGALVPSAWWSGPLVAVMVISYGRWKRRLWHASFERPVPVRPWVRPERHALLEEPATLSLAAGLAVVLNLRPMIMADALGHDEEALNSAAVKLRRNGYVEGSWYDGRATRLTMTRRGRRVFRRHLAALERATGQRDGA